MSMWETMAKELEGNEAVMYVAANAEISLESGHKAFEIYIKAPDGTWTRRMRGSAIVDRISTMANDLGIEIVSENPVAGD